LQIVVAKDLKDGKVRNIEAFKFGLQIARTKPVYLSELRFFMISSIQNPVIFYKEVGFDWLLELEHSEEASSLTRYFLYVLRDLRVKCLEFLIKMAGLEGNKDYLIQILLGYLSGLVFEHLKNGTEIENDGIF
jgi:hypothetical protein